MAFSKSTVTLLALLAVIAAVSCRVSHHGPNKAQSSAPRQALQEDPEGEFAESIIGAEIENDADIKNDADIENDDDIKNYADIENDKDIRKDEDIEDDAITPYVNLTCYDCTTREIRKPNIVVLVKCKNNYRPFCYEGFCSTVPAPECS